MKIGWSLCYSRRVIRFQFHQARPCRRLRAATVIGLMLASALARADAGDPLNFFLGTTVRHEANLFRLPSGIDPQLVVGKSTKADQVSVVYVGARVDKSFSQQRFQLDVTSTDYRYQTFSQLNFDAQDYRALWMWRLTQRLGGNLSAERKQVQANFADYRNFSGNNTRTTENRRFDTDWWLHGSWHLTGGVSQYRQSNSQTFTADDSFRQRAVDAGVRYVAESGSSLTLLGRTTQGKYGERVLSAASLLDTGFTQSDTEVRMNWLLSGHSSISGRVTRLARTHEHFGERDFSGTAGRLDYIWTPTGKLQLKFSAARELTSYQEATNSYYVNNGLTFAPVWQISDKAALRVSLERSQRDYRGGGTALPLVARQDRVRSALVSFDWSPIRALSLSAMWQLDHRDSNNPNLGFEANAASIAAQLSF